MKQFDVIVIGSGGGAKITSPAARLGLKVACIEKDRLGGTCLNRGCIPSKMLIHPADVASEIKEAKKFSIQNDPRVTVDFMELITRISNTVDADSSSIAAGYTKNPNITYYKGQARFVDNKTVEVNGETLTAEKIFVAVGTRPQIPAIEGLAGTPYMTSTEALRNPRLPKKMIVLGGGYIAVELGYAYAAFGCDVHFLVRSKLLRLQDGQVSDEFNKVFARDHAVHYGAVPTKVKYSDGQFILTYTDKNNTSQEISGDALLVATGITPNTDTLFLEKTQIKVDEKGFIIVDDFLRTTVDGIWSMGDCIGRYFFRHSVNFEGEYLFRTIFTDKTNGVEPIRYPPVPHAVFTRPQVAGVGKTEEQLKAEGIDYVVGLNPYKSSAMGMALLSDHGFCKILIDRSSRRILGAHIIGPEASDMIHMLIAFMNMQGTLDDLLRMIYIHPALPEVVRNAARKAQEVFAAQEHLLSLKKV